MQVVHPCFWEGVRSAHLAGVFSLAWNSAEISPVRAFISADGPLPASGVRLCLGSAQFKTVAVEGPVVGKLRADIAGSNDGQSVHLYKDTSVSGIILQRCRLRCVLSVMDSIARHDFSVSRSLELGVQWDVFVAACPCAPLCRADLAISLDLGLPVFGACVRSLYDSMNAFLHACIVLAPLPCCNIWCPNAFPTKAEKKHVF